MGESLGKASLELDVDMRPLERGLKLTDTRVDESKRNLEKLERQAKAAERALKNIKMLASQGVETDAAVETMQRTVDGLKDKAAEARLELKGVKVTEAQAVESEVAGHRIESTLDKISRKAGEARRALLGARLAGAGGAGGGGGLNGPLSVVGPGFGRGVGPFGSGYGRLGLVGTSILGGAILGPAAGPGALGLLAAIPTVAAAGTGALATLALAFAGVGKAIAGDKKAFEALQPAQQAFVTRIRSMKGWLDSLRETAGEALFPGLNRGIAAALSPGTLGAITTAVRQFGTAIGGAGEQVGRYFGSAQFQQIFGPLMEEGAHEIGTLTTTVLSLFDALGVLGRSGIPLTRWITDAAAKGARLVDVFTRTQDASGGLSHAMDEAQDSLRTVARLGLALVHVAGALGEALYPVSRVAVKDLTGGLEGLADSIHRNQGQIREIVGGALAALKSSVETIAPLLGKLVDGLDSVADAIGGWDKAFQIIISGYLVLKLLAVGDAITKIGIASGEAGAAGQTGLLLSRLGLLARLGPIAITMYLVIKNKDQIDSWLQSHHLGFLTESGIDLAKHTSDKMGWTKSVRKIAGSLGIGGGGQGIMDDIPGWVSPPTSKYFFTDNPTTGTSQGTAGGGSAGSATGLNLPQSIQRAILEAQAGHGDLAKAYAAAYSYYEQLRQSPGLTRSQMDQILSSEALYSTPSPAFTKNLGPKGPKPSALDIVFPPRMQAALLGAKANAAGGGLHALQRLLTVAKTSLEYLDKEHRTGKKLVALQRERAQIAALIATTEGKIAKAEEKLELRRIAIPQRLKDALANAKAALSLTTSSPDSAASLSARASALAKVVTAETAILDRLKAQHVTGKALVKQQAELGQHSAARSKVLGPLAAVATHAGIASMIERTLGIGSGPTMSGQVASLRERERGLLEKVLRKKTGTPQEKLAGLSINDLLDRASPFLTKASRKSLGLVGKAWETYIKTGFLPDSAITNVKTRLQQFNDTITASFDKLSLSAAQVARKQERSFLEAFQAIQSNYAPNASGGAVATHLYDIKHETRRQTKAVEKIARRTHASASDYSLGLGVFG